MKVIMFGATGMVGQGVLRECRHSDHVDDVLTVGRTATGAGGKVRDLIETDLFQVDGYADHLDGYDACFFCLGLSSAGIPAEQYDRITHQLTLAVAQTLAVRSPGMTFIYVSAAGADPQGRSAWARAKGRTEQELLALPLDVYLLRPGYIQPLHGERSRTRWYRLAYALASPLYPVLRRVAPGALTSTVSLGRAMLALAAVGWPTRLLDSRAINAAAGRAGLPVPPGFAAGDEISVSLTKAGRVKLRYPARVLSDDGNHLVVRADWAATAATDLGHVTFQPGDVFTEHYWRDRYYSVKQVNDAAGVAKGWYCDVSRPVVLRAGGIVADDLDLDLWVSADLATIACLDEDEFIASGLAERQPILAARARTALAELETLAHGGFAELSQAD